MQVGHTIKEAVGNTRQSFRLSVQLIAGALHATLKDSFHLFSAVLLVLLIIKLLTTLSTMTEVVLVRSGITTGNVFFDGVILGGIVVAVLHLVNRGPFLLYKWHSLTGHGRTELAEKSSQYRRESRIRNSSLEMISAVFPPSAKDEQSHSEGCKSASQRILTGLFTLTPWAVYTVICLPNPLPLCILLAIILHELGHFFAMVFFGYRNPGIVFLPGLGAAAYGTKPDTTPTEWTIVLLAGPIPGMMLGAALLWLQTPIPLNALSRLPEVLVVLNVINLFPAWPLDGGRICWQLYSRRSLFMRNVLPIGTAAFLTCLLTGSCGLLTGVMVGACCVGFLPGYRRLCVAADRFLNSAGSSLPTTLDRLSAEQRDLLLENSRNLSETSDMTVESVAQRVFDLAVVLPHGDNCSKICGITYIFAVVVGCVTCVKIVFPPRPPVPVEEHQQYPYTLDDLPSPESYQIETATFDLDDCFMIDIDCYDRYGHMFMGWWNKSLEREVLSSFDEL